MAERPGPLGLLRAAWFACAAQKAASSGNCRRSAPLRHRRRCGWSDLHPVDGRGRRNQERHPAIQLSIRSEGTVGSATTVTLAAPLPLASLSGHLRRADARWKLRPDRDCRVSVCRHVDETALCLSLHPKQLGVVKAHEQPACCIRLLLVTPPPPLDFDMAPWPRSPSRCGPSQSARLAAGAQFAEATRMFARRRVRVAKSWHHNLLVQYHCYF